jgi:hypothetical protein
MAQPFLHGANTPQYLFVDTKASAHTKKRWVIQKESAKVPGCSYQTNFAKKYLINIDGIRKV